MALSEIFRKTRLQQASQQQRILEAKECVTSPCHFVQCESAAGRSVNILIDCSKACGDAPEIPFTESPGSPEKIDYLFWPHAYIDYIGRIPDLINAGFAGEISCSHDAMSFSVRTDREIHNLEKAIDDRFEVEPPLVLVNSFFTKEVTEGTVGRTPLMILNFNQNEYSRLLAEGMSPHDTGCKVDLCPFAHGDFHICFYDYGLLDQLLQLGYRWVFASNIDKLHADICPAALGMMIDKCHYILLEIAQVEPQDEVEFQDKNTFRCFNTNNLWIDMEAIRELIQSKGLKIPIIVTPETILEHPVIQEETATGAATGAFSKPTVIKGSRSRFFPDKKMKDFSILPSDSFCLNHEPQILPNPQRSVTLPSPPRSLSVTAL